MSHPDLITSPIWEEPGNVELLTKLFHEGLSFGKIAEIMGQGLTRNACLGKAKRMKLDRPRRTRKPGRGNPGQARVGGIVARAQTRERAVARAELQHSSNAVFRAGSLPPEDVGVDVTSLIGFADRRIGKDCAWIHGDPLGGAMCCGKQVKDGTQWCEVHYARVYPPR